MARYSPAHLARQIGAKWLLISQDHEEHITLQKVFAADLDHARLAAAEGTAGAGRGEGGP